MKNKEIEELLNELKDKYSYEPYDTTGKVYTTISYEEGQLLLSYIEQLKNNYIEANENITWWTNRYNAIVKQNDDNHKKVVKLENNRDKAIEYIKQNATDENGDIGINFYASNTYELLNILKGDSDE